MRESIAAAVRRVDDVTSGRRPGVEFDDGAYGYVDGVDGAELGGDVDDDR